MRDIQLLAASLGLLLLVAVVVHSTQDDESTSLLLQSVPVQAELPLASAAQPVHLYYVPEGASLAQLPQQAPVREAAPMRFVYVPGTALVNTPQGERYVRFYEPEPVQQQLAAVPKAAVPSVNAIVSKRAKEITALRKALNAAETHEANYEKQVHLLADRSVKASHVAMQEQANLAKAAQLKNWAKMEKAAAARLAKVEKMAEARVAKQNAAVSKLLPVVREEVSRRRVLEHRLAQAAMSARNSEQQEMWERQRLMEDMQMAQRAAAHARLATMSYQTMQKRAVAMQQEANADRKQAKDDIKEARASVVGARKSAAKTLAAIRAVMTSKTKGIGGISAIDEQNFARAARHATKEMSSKKRAAKALREEARQLDSQSRELTMSAAQWQQEIPGALAKARSTEAEAQRLREQLKNTMQNAIPSIKQVQSASQLTQVSSGSAANVIHQLAVSEQQHEQAAALLARVSRVAHGEQLKAERDAVLARRRMDLARKRLQAAVTEHKQDLEKMKGLKTVLGDAKTELAELETEARDIAGTTE